MGDTDSAGVVASPKQMKGGIGDGYEEIWVVWS
jgi:hypothetical protein